jgi:hypothetical protein
MTKGPKGHVPLPMMWSEVTDNGAEHQVGLSGDRTRA